LANLRKTNSFTAFSVERHKTAALKDVRHKTLLFSNDSETVF